MGGVLKWWVSPTNPWAFPTKNDQHLGWRLGVPPFKETPMSIQYVQRFIDEHFETGNVSSLNMPTHICTVERIIQICHLSSYLYLFHWLFVFLVFIYVFSKFICLFLIYFHLHIHLCIYIIINTHTFFELSLTMTILLSINP